MPAQFPHSQRAYERMLSLPIYTAHDAMPTSSASSPPCARALRA